MAGAIFDTEKAADYYDDAVVSDFYWQCWGGEDTHIRRYATGNETVAQSSADMTWHLLDCAGLGDADQVLDLACGFGGALRTLARSGSQVKGIDISKNCVDQALTPNEEAGLADRIEVAVGDFHRIDSPADVWDAVICQESIIHSTDRPRVFAEVHRVLRPGGIFALSDIVTCEGADISMVEAAFARLEARAGATTSDYQSMTRAGEFEIAHAEERLDDIQTNNDNLAAALSRPVAGLAAGQVASISQSISRWQAALADGHITLACVVARKPG